MANLIKLCLSALVVLAVIFVFFYTQQLLNKRKKEFAKRAEEGYSVEGESSLLVKLRLPALLLVLVVAILIGVSSLFVFVSAGEAGIAYHLDGRQTELVEGNNIVAPWTRVQKLSLAMVVTTFSQGENDDDIYGAQTTEKDFIVVVATVGIHINPAEVGEYVKLYGFEPLNSEKLQRLLKTMSRDSIARVFGLYTTAEVMGNVNKIGEEARVFFEKDLAKLHIIVDSFTIDDLVAPDSYENAIKEQAQLRMDRDKASLRQEINAREAEANRIKAEGEAKVAKTNAEAEATVKEIAAENAAKVAKIEADNQAAIKAIQAEADANVRKIAAEAKANEITTQANADAEATIKRGEAEAQAISAQGEAYNTNPKLLDLRKAEISAEVEAQWANKWSGFSFEGMSGLNFADLTEVFKNLIPNFNTPAATN